MIGSRFERLVVGRHDYPYVGRQRRVVSSGPRRVRPPCHDASLWLSKDPTNAEIADAFPELGTLYELDGADPLPGDAYRDAAKTDRAKAPSRSPI